MISAMPAVALRRERKKGKVTSTGLVTSSQQGSLASLARSNIQQHQAACNRKLQLHHQSGGANQARFIVDKKKPVDILELDYTRRERLNYFVYAGTFSLAVGIIILFIGVSVDQSSTQALGLLFIITGSLLCITRVVLSEKHIKPKSGSCKSTTTTTTEGPAGTTDQSKRKKNGGQEKKVIQTGKKDVESGLGQQRSPEMRQTVSMKGTSSSSSTSVHI